MRFRIAWIAPLLIFCPMMNATSENEVSLATSPVITVAAVGDIMMGTDYPSPKLPGKGGKLLFEELKDTLREADIVFGNLEGPLYDGGSPAKKVKDKESYVFRTPTRFVKNLVEAGFNVVSLANNHAEDFGSQGMSSTKKVLDTARIKYSQRHPLRRCAGLPDLLGNVRRF